MYKGVPKNICINLNLSKFQDAGQLRRRLFLDTYKCLSSSRAYLARQYNRLSSLLAAQDASRKKSLPLNKNSILMTLINDIVYIINLVVTGF